MVAVEVEACGQEIQEYVQLQMFSLEGDELCPINYKQVKRTLGNKKLGHFQMHHIGAPERERRGNTILDTNDVFGRSRHNSEQIRRVFYDNGKVTWNGEQQTGLKTLPSMQKENPNFVRPFQCSLLDTTDLER